MRGGLVLVLATVVMPLTSGCSSSAAELETREPREFHVALHQLPLQSRYSRTMWAHPAGPFPVKALGNTPLLSPTLRLELITSLDDLDGPLQTMTRAAAAGLLVVMLSILLISCAGIFSLMSFNVTQRRREIGIRSALGANPRRVLVSVMVRSVKQLGIGVLVGLSVAAAIPEINIADALIQRDMRLLMGVAVLMVTVGMLAAAGPASAI